MRLSRIDEEAQAIQSGSLGVDRRREQSLSDDPRGVPRSERLGEELEPTLGLVVRKRMNRRPFRRRPVVTDPLRNVQVGVKLGLVAGEGRAGEAPRS